MTLDEFKAHIATAEAELLAKWNEVVAWVENKQATEAATIAAEIADLTSKGYTVIPPPETPAV